MATTFDTVKYPRKKDQGLGRGDQNNVYVLFSSEENQSRRKNKAMLEMFVLIHMGKQSQLPGMHVLRQRQQTHHLNQSHIV